MEKILISIIIPCYNETKFVKKTVIKVLKSLKTNHLLEYEIILIDDKSTDDTKLRILELKKKYIKIKTILNTKNLGLGGSLKKGFKLGKVNFIMWLPGDDAHDEKDIKKLIKFIKQKKKDIIISLNNKSSRSLIREFFSKCYVFLLNIIFLQSVKYYNGANIYKKEIIKKIIKTNLSNSHFFLAEVLIKALRYTNDYHYVNLSVNKQDVSNAINLLNLLKVIKDIIKLRLNFLCSII